MSSFVGRQDQVEHVAQALQTSALVSLVGTGGVGKTRIALRTAGTVAGNYAHGVWLVELAALSAPERVVEAVATVLGVAERPGIPLVETLAHALAGRQLLIVLDNCEHLISACVDLLTALLPACADLYVLATSREPLGIAGEVVCGVEPLPVPSEEGSFDDFVKSEAVQLLVTRIQAADPSFALTPHNAPVAGRICRLVDGLPLAIELAAARVSTMNASDIAARLSDPLSLLTHGQRNAPARHQTLRATIDWSVQLLNEPERMLLCRLAVFNGGCTVDAVVQVCGGDLGDEHRIFDLLDASRGLIRC